MRQVSGFRHLKAAYRSGLEATISAAIAALGVTASYESHRIPFTEPAKPRHYTPDFVLPNGVVIESKGIFDSADRAKHLLIRGQHPDLDIRFVFTRSKSTIAKGSKTTYADWCQKNGYRFADKEVPSSWIEEKPCHARIAAVERFRRSSR